MNKIWSYIGGKRGLAVIIGAVATIGVQLGLIPPEVALKISEVAGVLGIAGIAHNAKRVA